MINADRISARRVCTVSIDSITLPIAPQIPRAATYNRIPAFDSLNICPKPVDSPHKPPGSPMSLVNFRVSPWDWPAVSRFAARNDLG
jgi:hypothetical protein